MITLGKDCQAVVIGNSIQIIYRNCWSKKWTPTVLLRSQLLVIIHSNTMTGILLGILICFTAESLSSCIH